eukprot:TRINITY_DN41727_c0_g1_i1.p1 TRINITY_DN41727_c0_g1~~TRINITY_DN41727_c0_g1_i1.p1  ORF type:complete len:501 (+),score=102.32 TRINITY_DN41727_c0_g1_i1:77-1579(+)
MALGHWKRPNPLDAFKFADSDTSSDSSGLDSSTDYDPEEDAQRLADDVSTLLPRGRQAGSVFREFLQAEYAKDVGKDSHADAWKSRMEAQKRRQEEEKRRQEAAAKAAEEDTDSEDEHHFYSEFLRQRAAEGRREQKQMQLDSRTFAEKMTTARKRQKQASGVREKRSYPPQLKPKVKEFSWQAWQERGLLARARREAEDGDADTLAERLSKVRDFKFVRGRSILNKFRVLEKQRRDAITAAAMLAQQGPPPIFYLISSDVDTQRCSGKYEIIPNKVVNGACVWKNSSRPVTVWMYTARNGHWFIGEEDDYRFAIFESGGLLRTSEAHRGRQPTQMAFSWQEGISSVDWVHEPDVFLLDPRDEELLEFAEEHGLFTPSVAAPDVAALPDASDIRRSVHALYEIQAQIMERDARVLDRLGTFVAADDDCDDVELHKLASACKVPVEGNAAEDTEEQIASFEYLSGVMNYVQLQLVPRILRAERRADHLRTFEQQASTGSTA